MHTLGLSSQPFLFTGNVYNKVCDQINKVDAEVCLDILGKVCLVALAVFALYVSWKLFLPFFVVGIIIGALTYVPEQKGGCHSGSCSTGFLEEVTGVKLPRVILLALAVGNLAVHVDHHPNIFVPSVGIFTGAWIGRLAAKWYCRNTQQNRAPEPSRHTCHAHSH